MAKRKGKKAIKNIMNTGLPDIDSVTIERGRAAIEAILQKYGDVPLGQVDGVKSVKTISTTWEERPKSNIVKWLMEKSGRTLKEVAGCLGCTVHYLNNKLYRDSFTVDDLIIIAYVCGFVITFTSNNQDDKERSVYQIDVKDYFGAYDTEALERLCAFEKKNRDIKRSEYEELKAQLEQMKAEYGFED